MNSAVRQLNATTVGEYPAQAAGFYQTNISE